MPTPPGVISPNSMFSIVPPPPSPVKLSCSELTAPVDVPVVASANNALPGMPNRSSLPSSGRRPLASAPQITASIAAQRPPMTLSST